MMWHVICYESKNPKEHGNKIVTHDLELITTIHALKMWRRFLMGRKFELRTYRNGMKYLFQ
jgi:hypothetical protein